MLDSDHMGPVNIDNPDEYTIRQLAETVIKTTASSSSMVFEALSVGDPQVRRPDISLARRVLGWEPKDLREGLVRTVEYFRRGRA